MLVLTSASTMVASRRSNQCDLVGKRGKKMTWVERNPCFFGPHAVLHSIMTHGGNHRLWQKPLWLLRGERGSSLLARPKTPWHIINMALSKDQGPQSRRDHVSLFLSVVKLVVVVHPHLFPLPSWHFPIGGMELQPPTWISLQLSFSFCHGGHNWFHVSTS